jgi:hypothetical protein
MEREGKFHSRSMRRNHWTCSWIGTNGEFPAMAIVTSAGMAFAAAWLEGPVAVLKEAMIV